MNTVDVLQIIAFCALLIALTPVAGGYMARVFSGERVLLGRVLGPAERGIYRLCGIRADQEQHWTAYALAMLAFNLLGDGLRDALDPRLAHIS